MSSLGQAARNTWYDAYPILHKEAPVLVLSVKGIDGVGDAFVLSCYEDIELLVKDSEHFTPLMSLKVQEMQAMLDRGEKPSQDTSRFDIALDSVRTLRPDQNLWRAHRKPGPLWKFTSKPSCFPSPLLTGG